DVLYGKASAEKYGQAVSNFYRTLKDSGMTDDQAFRLTEQYMSSLNLGKIIEGAVGSERGRHRGGDEGRREIRVKMKGKEEGGIAPELAERLARSYHDAGSIARILRNAGVAGRR